MLYLLHFITLEQKIYNCKQIIDNIADIIIIIKYSISKDIKKLLNIPTNTICWLTKYSKTVEKISNKEKRIILLL